MREPVDALLIIDVQVAHVTGPGAVPSADALVAQTTTLLDHARAAGALVVHVQNDGAEGLSDAPGTPGWDLHFPVVDGEPVVRKVHDDAFADTGLTELLAQRDVGSLVVCGLMSEMCVSATARTALARGFRVVLPRDAHATTGIPAMNGADPVPAEVVSRVAEWALGDELESVPHAAEVSFRPS
ncbi:nicotinamidase-related amidase [Kribbella amoyensis]|uniref:Nicotinamidase-related amidase n=1 Tax=Kribbella amoyensis TaxID=996641 RepID=A0A561BX32_9ACTN|nr:cysteine hydrolase family protein [Kribbella amoyensis]TWD83407.1 nicotinamidase-related amidase [Kribbella amoyensis]